MINHIRFYREKKGITLEHLANETGISAGYLSHLERGGRNNPSFKIMENLSKKLEVELWKLFEV